MVGVSLRIFVDAHISDAINPEFDNQISVAYAFVIKGPSRNLQAGSVRMGAEGGGGGGGSSKTQPGVSVVVVVECVFTCPFSEFGATRHSFQTAIPKKTLAGF